MGCNQPEIEQEGTTTVDVLGVGAGENVLNDDTGALKQAGNLEKHAAAEGKKAGVAAAIKYHRTRTDFDTRIAQGETSFKLDVSADGDQLSPEAEAALSDQLKHMLGKNGMLNIEVTGIKDTAQVERLKRKDIFNRPNVRFVSRKHMRDELVPQQRPVNEASAA